MTTKTIPEILENLYAAGVVAGRQIPEKTGLGMVIAGEILPKEATKAITQAMLDAVPKVNRVGYSGLCKTCEKPCDLDTCVCDGRNETILEIRSAIKLKGGSDE